MSIRNPQTGRHEDDLYDLAYRHDGDVPISELLAHAREIIVSTPEAYGAYVSSVVCRLVELVEDNARTGERIELENTVPLFGWDK